MDHGHSKPAAGTLGRPPTMALPAVLLAAALAGCTSWGPHLTLRDSRSREAEALVTVRPTFWSRSGGVARGFEAGWQQSRAEGPHDLPAGSIVQRGGLVISGPEVLAQKARLSTWHLGFADRFYFGPAFELDLGVGGMKAQFDYEFVPASGVVGPQAWSRDYTMPYGALTPRWRFNPWLALEARLVAAGIDDPEYRRVDAAVVLSPLPPLSLRLGWSQRRSRLTVGDLADFPTVDVTVRSGGPMASLRIDF